MTQQYLLRQMKACVMCRQAVKPKSTVKVIEAAREGQKLQRDFGSVTSEQDGDMFVVVWEDDLQSEEEGDIVEEEVG